MSARFYYYPEPDGSHLITIDLGEELGELFCDFFVDAVESYGPTLGRYQGTANFEAYLYVGGSNVAERNDNAINLASDGVKAITANRQLALGSLVDDVLVSYTALDGDKYGLSGIGIGMIRINVKFVSDDGT